MRESTISNFPQPSSWESMSYEQAMRTASSICEKPDFCVDGYDDDLCGPVVTLHALASQSREDFCSFTNHAYRDADKVVPKDVKKNPFSDKPEVSLMVMLSAFLVNQSNSFFRYYGTHSAYDVCIAKTSSSDVKFWLKELFPTRHVSSYTDIQKVNKLWESDKPLAIIARVNIPSKHYMQILSPFTQTPDGKIQFRAFTRGQTKEFVLSEKDFDDMMDKMIVAY